MISMNFFEREANLAKSNHLSHSFWLLLANLIARNMLVYAVSLNGR
jgi:hypothetical protein